MLLLDVHRTFRKTGKKMKVKVAQSCLTLCNTMDCSTLVSSVHRILQTRILEWVAMPSSRGSSQPRDQTSDSWSSCIAGRFFTAELLFQWVAQQWWIYYLLYINVIYLFLYIIFVFLFCSHIVLESYTM